MSRPFLRRSFFAASGIAFASIAVGAARDGSTASAILFGWAAVGLAALAVPLDAERAALRGLVFLTGLGIAFIGVGISRLATDWPWVLAQLIPGAVVIAFASIGWRGFFESKR